jgi:hypothetical protein
VTIFLLLASLIGVSQVIVSRLSGQSDSLSTLKASETSLNNQLSELDTAKANVAKYGPLAELAESIVPRDKNQAEAVREIVNIAQKNNIRVGSIAYPQSSLGSPTQKNAGAKINLSQLTPIKGLSGVYQLQITVSSDVNYPITFKQLIRFLRSLEDNRRTSQVSNIKLDPDADQKDKLSFTISINEYIKP